MNQQKLNI